MKLPMVAAHAHPISGELIFVRRGYEGYWTANEAGVVSDELTPEKWNEAHGITAGMAESMYLGSMFGWDCPAADPNNWTPDGQPKVKRRLDD